MKCPRCGAEEGTMHSTDCFNALGSVDSTLDERHSEYGTYISNADISQQLKSVIHDSPNWEKLHSDQKESMDMFALKISRILNGNQNNIDSWKDIAGYAKLAADRLLGISR